MLTLMVSLGVVYCEPPLSSQYGVPENLPVSNNHELQGGVTNSYGTPLGSDHHHHDEQQDYIDNQVYNQQQTISTVSLYCTISTDVLT